MEILIALSVVVIIVAVVVILNIKIVPQSMTYVVERFGAYKETWQTGLHVKIPVVERVARQVSMKEKVADFPPKPVITKDNVTFMIDSVVFYQITDPKLYAYGIEKPLNAIENLIATILRNIIGELELDQTLTSRETINSRMRQELDVATDPWGIKVNRVELKSIEPPADIKNAMEKQMKAEREKRAKILAAEAEKESQITEAEGLKTAAILRADAVREARIREAQGEADAILSVQRAHAVAIKLINEAQPGNAYLSLQALKSFEAAANGQATKIIIPSEIQGIAGLAKGILEAVNG
ncbi:MAG: SPFH/Band 7/PHB domain protein [Oscillospiraceae bacterium]|jgi:regulator of protease activity HflC (stomatin/prohibitin superfamily)|nr:SPFH/Band 7/PHB domain protein [Oscillospiraceae bacterium]